MNYVMQEMPKVGDIVVVGMSGGVDSTLTALMLKEKGCKVIGATMSLWDGLLPELKEGQKIKPSCYSPNEITNIEECKKFCAENDIEYHVIDVKEIYKNEVLEYFKSEYRNGRTPNPCIKCNKEVKFGALLDGLKNLDIKYDYFCTGHYAKIIRPEEGIFGTKKKPFMIASAEDVSKDQTYFLYRISSEILEKVRFPLASMKKSDVLKIARQANLKAALREESQDFIGEEYFDLIFSDKPSVPGDIIDLDGKILGRHRGIEHYTVGQRRSLGVAVGYPVYVHSIDAKNNVVVLAKNDDLNALSLIADDFVWAGNVEPQKTVEAMVKIRFASKPVPAKIERFYDDFSANSESDFDSTLNSNCKKFGESKIKNAEFKGQPWKVTFEQPQRAIAPGQSVVLYQNGAIIGGGIINRVI